MNGNVISKNSMNHIGRNTGKNIGKNILRELKKNKQLYFLIAIPVIYILIFQYWPMYGAQIAFKDFDARKGIWDSAWVGFKYFTKFFQSYQFGSLIRNTLEISIYSSLAGFPIPIILAIALNTAESKFLKKTVQMTTYAPHFISMVVLVGIISQFLSPKFGVVNQVIRLLGGEEVIFMGEPNFFSSIYVWSGIWQNAGWGSIIYLAALSAVDTSIHEAAIIDGASRFKRIIHIDLPGIKPTIVILLILDLGRLMSVGFEKILLLQNPMNMQRAEIISSFVYKVGLASSMPDYSYSTAIGLFNSVINFTLLIIVNKISRRVAESSLW